MFKRDLHDERIFLIEEFLSPDECRELIAQAERIGFEDAPITTSAGTAMRKDVRSNTRILHQDFDLAARLFERAEPMLVPSCYYRAVSGFNELFRFYRYEPGQRFAPHLDGRFERGDGERSEFTFLIYLNEDFEGGATRFYLPDVISVQPQTGSALVFYHKQMHEGAVIEAGTKYVLRTDVMYRGGA